MLALAIAAVLPITVFADAGRVNFAMGRVQATGSEGQRRVLTRGSAINSGDTIETSTGRAHLRFTDGSYISLRPGSQFRIDEYRFKGKTDGRERGFFSMLRGGLRTLTGLIGKVNNSTYRVNTETATIGIRGTHYSVFQVSPPRGFPREPLATRIENYPQLTLLDPEAKADRLDITVIGLSPPSISLKPGEYLIIIPGDPPTVIGPKPFTKSEFPLDEIIIDGGEGGEDT